MSEVSARRRPDEPAVIEWSGSEMPGRLLSRSVGRWSAPLVAGLGAVAVFASLVEQWGTLTLPGRSGPDESSSAVITQRVADTGNLGVVYLVGVLGLLSTAALVIFGTGNARHNARLIGAATGVGVLAILAATTATLDEPTQLVFDRDIELRVSYGRGLVMAYVGTVCLGLAHLLAVGPSPAGSGQAGTAGSDTPFVGDGPWRRRRHNPEPWPGADAQPLDLTVGPARPFAPPGRD